MSASGKFSKERLSELLEKFEPVIGLEVHAQLQTESKMFCPAPHHYGQPANSQIGPVSSGQPGTLPVVNQKAIELGIRAALALEGTIHPRSVFSRKHYFYPDLPKGYQISQFDKPYCENARLEISFKSGDSKMIGITRIHFEEDAGKSTHQGQSTLVNLNRAGVPLIEIVSEPDFRSAEEAVLYLKKLHNILKFAGVCDGNLEQGNFRCDANVSVRPRGQQAFGTRTELKNINSFRYVEKAIEYEIFRQSELLLQGGVVKQQTRLWNTQKNITELMREKEEASDYRYFPEPDLPPLLISQTWIDQIQSELPELPQAIAQRFEKDFGLSRYDAGVLSGSRELADYFEQVCQGTDNVKLAANWIANELLGQLNSDAKEISESPISATHFATLVSKIDSGELSGKMAKTVFSEMYETGGDPQKIIENKGLKQISGVSELTAVVQKILDANPGQVQAYKNGKIKLLGFFVGQAMKATKGQANPEVLNQVVKELLG